jgi:predicted DNA binding CopG/RHH family protein
MMQEIFIGRIGVPSDDGSVRFDMAIIKELIYKVEIHQNKTTFVKCINKNNHTIAPDQDILQAIKLWASNNNFAGLNLQTFIKKLLTQA